MAEKDNDFAHDVFSSDSLWKSSSFFEDPTICQSLFAPLQLDVPATNLDDPYAPKHDLKLELKLSALNNFDFGPLPDIERLDTSVSADSLPLEEQEGDLWHGVLGASTIWDRPLSSTWEAFDHPNKVQSEPVYLTEAGPAVFDAAARTKGANWAMGRVFQRSIFLESLWNLGLGRSSALFAWDQKARTFIQAPTGGLPSGLSPEAANGVASSFILTGNTFRYLRTFADRTFSSTVSIPARVALAASISSILATVEEHLGLDSNAVESVLQLQNLFSGPRDMLVHVARLVDVVNHSKSNEQLASILYERVLETEEDEVLRNLSSAILSCVSRPTLELIGEWIGIQKEQGITPITSRCKFLVPEGESQDQYQTEYAYDPTLMPLFITYEEGKMIFETGKSLRFIRSHHPGHPLVTLEVQPPDLEWRFSWKDIDDLAAKARAYEESLRSAIRNFGSNNADEACFDPVECPSPVEFPQFRLPADGDPGILIEQAARIFDTAPTRTAPNEIQALALRILTGKVKTDSVPGFSPPLSMTSTLSFRPLLAAHAKLVNATALRLFFRQHQLRAHLSLQRQYQLLGNGVFSSRLASALFDPERETAERRKGLMRSGVRMGLQVGSRSAWPPASSELRLALMGVLSDSFFSSALYRDSVAKGTSVDTADEALWSDRDELPGQLNFVVRQLSEAEMEKVMDPDSLCALDFLRLQYVPPNPLHLVISTSALEKYDVIFRFMLRLLRMLFVISRLPRTYATVEGRWFRMEAHHFVSCVSSYMFESGIAEHWDAFDLYLSTVERRLDEEDLAGELGTRVTSSLESLRRKHEDCLDSIMFSLLLRRRQKKVMALMEEVFDHILHFAQLVRRGESENKDQVKSLYATVRGKMRVFISVCKGLTGRKGYGKGKGKGTAEENSLERLAVLLEMNPYYAG